MQHEQAVYNASCRPGHYVRQYHRAVTGPLQKVPHVRTGPLEIEDMPTTLIQRTRLPSEQVEAVRPQFPIDVYGRPYIGVTNPYEDTAVLAASLIRQFCAERGVYPDVIFLTAFRYFTRNSNHFCVGETFIPYVYDAHALFPFDVMVRGNRVVL